MGEKLATEKAAMDGTILLLISELIVRHVVREVLERTGYVVLATGDLGTAVDRIHDARPDLLIISHYVESITGREAAKYLHLLCPGMRILILAGLLADDRLQLPAELERFDIFPKPFTATEFLAKVSLITQGISALRRGLLNSGRSRLGHVASLVGSGNPDNVGFTVRRLA